MNASKESSKKVVVIGLDGATLDLIKPWAEEGKLPTFKEMLTEGVHGILRSTIPHVTIPAWPSFATGVNPGKHGLYDFFKDDGETYNPKIEPQPSRAIKVPTLWQILGEQDKRVAIINVPSTFPPTKVNGYMITGLLTPPGAEYTYPTGFEKELVDKIGNYSVFSSPSAWKGSLDLFMADLEKALEERVKATLYLLEKDIDFLMVVDSGTDRAGHELWRFIDRSSPIFDPDELAKYGNLLLKYYQEVDRALKTILSKLNKEDTLFIMSDHGMGPVRKFISLNIFLMQQGFMKIKKGPVSKIRYFFFNNGWTFFNLDRFLRKLQIELYISKTVSNQQKSSLAERLFFSSRDIDWTKTTAYALGSQGGIRINLKGRESEGIVTPGAEYKKVRDDLINKLHSASDPSNGEKIVNDVFRCEEIYHGPYIEKAPDIIAMPKENYEFSRAYRFPFASVVQTTVGHSGSHRLNGVFMAVGEEIKKDREIKNANIIDLAPTILHTMDVPVPTNMDGKVLKEIFEPNSELGRKEVEYQEIDYEKVRVGEKVRKLKQIGRI